MVLVCVDKPRHHNTAGSVYFLGDDRVFDCGWIFTDEYYSAIFNHYRAAYDDVTPVVDCYDQAIFEQDASHRVSLPKFRSISAPVFPVSRIV